MNPLLSPLGDYGGITQTYLPLVGSPAINKGVNKIQIGKTLTTDQTGKARIIATTIDIGAVEAAVTACTNPLVVTSKLDTLLCGTLRYAVFHANNTKGANAITFATTLANDSIKLKSGLVVTDDLTITGQTGLVLTTTGKSNIISSGKDSLVLTLNRLTFKNSAGYSAAVNLDYSLKSGTVKNCVFRNNNSEGANGALFINGGQILIDSSKFINNSSFSNSDAAGGAVGLSAQMPNAKITVKNSEFIGNLVKASPSEGYSMEARGGGLMVSGYYQGAVLSMQNITSLNNIGGYGSGLFLAGTIKSSLVNSTISGNKSSGNGAGIYFQQDSLGILNSTIVNNATLANTSSVTNQEFTMGGGILANSGSVYLKNTIVAGNKSADKLGNDLALGGEGLIFTNGNNFI